MDEKIISDAFKRMAALVGVPSRYFQSWQDADIRVEVESTKKINRQDAFKNVVKKKWGE
ncbi:hypothetical protein [Paenilisteria newyorkensis]|uniref:hypothetical protein n=1 Tax=Listeria newyorkensis TaxID=1497681 RepID=UPI000669D8F0|nr:hypothetical protein [Listeria newyorkensis]KMT58910.1 hypothetical protein X559_2916 [Listeria newyorkensis]